MLFGAAGHVWRGAEPGIIRFGIMVDSLPMIALGPILVLWVGNGLAPRVTLATIAPFFPLLNATVQGLKSVDRNAADLFHLLGASPLQRWRKLALPSALASILPGLKIAAPLAILGALVAEWIGADRGARHHDDLCAVLLRRPTRVGHDPGGLRDRHDGIRPCGPSRTRTARPGAHMSGQATSHSTGGLRRAERQRFASRLIGTLRGPILVVVVVALAWKALVVVLVLPPYILPPPEAAWQALLDNGGTIGAASLFTLRNAVAGLSTAFLVALALAATFTLSPAVSRAVLPLVIVLRTAPVVAIAPILIMIFGRGIGVAVTIVVIVSFFPIMVNAMHGFGSTPHNALDLMHVLGAGAWPTFLKVRLPYALSQIFTGLRSAATSAILSAMLAEWLSGAPGLGKLLLDAASFRKTGLLWACVVVSMAIAYAAFSLSVFLEGRFKR